MTKESLYPSFESVVKIVKESYQKLTMADIRDFADQLQYYTISSGQYRVKHYKNKYAQLIILSIMTTRDLKSFDRRNVCDFSLSRQTQNGSDITCLVGCCAMACIVWIGISSL